MLEFGEHNRNLWMVSKCYVLCVVQGKALGHDFWADTQSPSQLRS